MLRDMELFKTKLQHIDGFGNTGDYLTDIIKSKHVKSASPPPIETKPKENGEGGFDGDKESKNADLETSGDNKQPADEETK